MNEETAPKVKIDLAEGVKGDIAELTALSPKDEEAHQEEIDALKHRLAELFLECEANPHAGELMGAGRHRDLVNCRRIRFDIDTHKGKPRFRLIYRNDPSDGAPARCTWLAVGPRSGLRAHRKARQRLTAPD